MTTEHDAGHLRRYILGAATNDECAAIERDYFERADALDQVSEVEDDLITDYLSNRLTSDERDRFERHYLTTPGHRRRVEVTRALRTAAHVRASGSGRTVSWWATAGVAAALVLAAGAGWLAVRSRSTSSTISGGGQLPHRRPRRTWVVTAPRPLPVNPRIRRRFPHPPPRFRSSSRYQSRRFSSAAMTSLRPSRSAREPTS